MGARCVLICLGLFASACYVGDAPLSAPGSAVPDGKLFGQWRCVSPEAASDDIATIRIAPFEATGYDVEFGERGSEPDRYRGHPSRVGPKVIVNLQQLRDGKPDDKGWVFARYDFLRSDVMQVRIIADRLLKDRETTRAASEVIRRHIESPALYSDFCVCVRVQPR